MKKTAVVGLKLPRPPRDLDDWGTGYQETTVYVKFQIQHGRRTALNIISKGYSRATRAAYNVECTFCQITVNFRSKPRFKTSSNTLKSTLSSKQPTNRNYKQHLTVTFPHIIDVSMHHYMKTKDM